MNTEPKATTSEATVFVVDDDPSVLDSISASLQSLGLKIECFSTAIQFLRVYDASRPGCVITDVRMPGMSGLQLQQSLSDQDARIPMIVISGHGDVPMVLTAMRHGAMDFLEKPYVPQQLRELVRRAVEKDAAEKRKSAQNNRVSGLLDKLTAEERQVVEGIASGKTAKVIAQELGVSLRTIQFRRASAMKTLNVNRAELVELVLEARKAAP